MRVGMLILAAAVSCGSPPAEAPPPSVGSAAPTTTASTGSAAASAAPTAAPATTSTAAGSSAPATPAQPAPVGGSVLLGDIPGTKKFDPKPTIEEEKSAMVACYNKARAAKPDLSGKIKLLIVVNAVGTVVKVDAEPGGSANDAALIACIGDTLKTVPFPKPGGMATVVAPMVFRP